MSRQSSTPLYFLSDLLFFCLFLFRSIALLFLLPVLMDFFLAISFFLIFYLSLSLLIKELFVLLFRPFTLACLSLSLSSLSLSLSLSFSLSLSLSFSLALVLSLVFLSYSFPLLTPLFLISSIIYKC